MKVITKERVLNEEEKKRLNDIYKEQEFIENYIKNNAHINNTSLPFFEREIVYDGDKETVDKMMDRIDELIIEENMIRYGVEDIEVEWEDSDF